MSVLLKKVSYCFSASELAEVVKLLTCVQEVPGSNLGSGTDYPDSNFRRFPVTAGEC
jgi:hypothetical protein